MAGPNDEANDEGSLVDIAEVISSDQSASDPHTVTDYDGNIVTLDGTDGVMKK